MSNKAHTATLNRLCQRFGVEPAVDKPYDILVGDVIIEVETSASLQNAVSRLAKECGPAYIAVTNKEGLAYALQAVNATGIGILDPRGHVVRPATGHELPGPIWAS